MKTILLLVLIMSALYVPMGSAAADEDSGITLIGNTADTKPATADPISGQDNAAAASPDLKTLLSTAFDKNPEIAAAKAEWRAAIEMYPQMRSLPDPSLNVKWMPGFMQPMDMPDSYEIQLMQMIPNPQMLRLMGDKALTMAEIAQVRYERMVRDVLVEVMHSYYELGYLDRAIDISKNNIDLFAQLVALGNLGKAQGKLGAAEGYAADSRLAQTNYELGLLEEMRAAEAANMQKLLGTQEATIGPVRLPQYEPAKLDLTALRNLVAKHRQELQMAGLSVELAVKDVSLAKAQNTIDYSLGLMYESMSEAPTGEDMSSSRNETYGIMFGITLPIWGGKNRARVDEAKAKLEAAKAELDNQSNSAKAAADKLYWQVKNQERLFMLYRDTLLPDAKKAAELAQTWYEQKQTDFSQLLETRLVVGNFELAAARAEADYLNSLADIARLAGAPVISSDESNSEAQQVPDEEVSK